MEKVLWHSTDDTSRLSTGSRRPEQVEGRLAVLLLNRIAPLFSFVAPCHAGASRDFHHGPLEMTPGVPQTPSSDFVIRAAAKSEADAVFRLISDNLEAGHLLPRPLGEVVLHAPRFLVAADAAGVVACAELTELSPRVAEVRSLVVSGSHRGHGVGTQLLAEILATARAQGYPILCAFTHDPRLFVRLGFSIVPHHWVPEKVSTDCHACIWFRRCQQYAVVLDLKIKGSSHDRRA